MEPCIRYYTCTTDLLSICTRLLPEVYNSVFLSSLQGEGFGSAIWQDDQLLFAIYVKEGNMYTTYEPGIQQFSVKLLIQDFINKGIPVVSVEAYQPVADIIVQMIPLQLLFHLWSYDIQRIDWTDKSLKIQEKSKLMQATVNDLEMIVDWTHGFFQDIEDNSKKALTLDKKELCVKEIELGHVYILYCEDVPVSMTWKRRPLAEGCSIAFVYTPLQHRRLGYGAVCVSMATELFLKQFKYVTLFVMGHQNPEKNMYTGIGYRLIGKVGRYAAIQ